MPTFLFKSVVTAAGIACDNVNSKEKRLENKVIARWLDPNPEILCTFQFCSVNKYILIVILTPTMEYLLLASPFTGLLRLVLERV